MASDRGYNFKLINMNITRFKKLMGIKYFLHFIVIITILSFGCTQKTVTDTPSDVTKLNENKTYIKLTLETNSFLQYLSETAKVNSLNMPDIIKSLNNIREKNLSFDDQMIEIDRIYKTNVSKRLLSHMKTYSETWPEINKTYKNLSKQVLESESTEIIDNNLKKVDELQIKSNNTDNNKKVNKDGGCGWRYSLCVGAATAGAIICHAGCETTALVTTAGLGIPVCVALCATLQAFAGMQCYDNYCQL